MADNSVVPSYSAAAPEAARDPLSKMIDIAKDSELSDADKKLLIAYAQNKFTNRRKMAYIALVAIVASLALLFVAAFIDGFSGCPNSSSCTGILTNLKENQTLLAWIEGFLTSIVAAYYGVSAWRPSS